MWYNPHGIAKVLSLNFIKQKYHVMYDSEDCGGIYCVNMPDDMVEFIPLEKGLHHLELGAPNNVAVLPITDGMITSGEGGGIMDAIDKQFSLITVPIIRKNYKGFTKQG